MHIHSTSLDVLCFKSWDANSIQKNSDKNDKLKLYEALEDKIPENLSCSALAYEIFYFQMNFYKNDFASQLLSKNTSSNALWMCIV